MAAPTDAQFTAQTAEKMSADKRRSGARHPPATPNARARAGTATPTMKRHRYTYDEAKGTTLYEGWKARPEIESDPSFHLINGPSGGSS